MNIVVAFTLEAFLLEYESQRTELETRVDRRIRELGLESKKSSEAVIFDREQSYVENGARWSSLAPPLRPRQLEVGLYIK